MYLSVNFGISEEVIIAFHELTTSLFIQTALWEGHNQQAFDDFEDVRKGPITGVPIFLQGVHTDLSWWHCNIGMENFGKEVTYIKKLINLS
jgi:hypothetical protein